MGLAALLLKAGTLPKNTAMNLITTTSERYPRSPAVPQVAWFFGRIVTPTKLPASDETGT
jgi:hypothetical protein